MKNVPNDQIKDAKLEESGGLGVRHIITLILCSCLAVNYILRVNLSVAVVVMTDANRTDGQLVFDWSPEEKGVLLSSFFAGYLVSNVVAGYFVTKYSNKKLLLMSVTYSTVASLVTPFLVNWGGFYVMFMLRVSMGLVQGFMMPVAQGLMSKWIPPFERSRCGSIVIGGTHIGTIVSFVSSGFLGDSPGGWPSIFYFSGLLSGVWCLLWYWYGADHPDSCTRISEKEHSSSTSRCLEQPRQKLQRKDRFPGERYSRIKPCTRS
uniref:Putative inorganic phosphate cotransporter n=1 Tax=Lygus hesperus TaxID=30085 RepID=A0A0A9VWY0_LYGHE